MPGKNQPEAASASPNPFVGSPRPPTPAELGNVLGRSAAAWEALRSRISEHFGPVSEEWAVPAKKHGWSLRLKVKKRTILHLGPRSGHFTVAVILGEKAVAAVGKSHLGPEIIAMIEESRRFTEGRVIRFEIRSKKETDIVFALAKIKMEN